MNRRNSAVRFVAPLAIFAFVSAYAISSWAQSAHKPDASNLLVNPGFETGDFTGWTVTGDSPNYGVNIAGFLITGGGFDGPTFVLVHSGNFAGFAIVCAIAICNPSGHRNGDFLDLSQTVNLVPGVTYSVGFWVGDGSTSAFGDSIYISVDGVHIRLTSDPQINPGYQFVGGVFTASNPTAVIAFHIQGSGEGDAGASFDDFCLSEDPSSCNRP